MPRCLRLQLSVLHLGTNSLFSVLTFYVLPLCLSAWVSHSHSEGFLCLSHPGQVPGSVCHCHVAVDKLIPFSESQFPEL